MLVSDASGLCCGGFGVITTGCWMWIRTDGRCWCGPTAATLLITSTNNAQIPIFKFALVGLTLVDTNGTEVPVLTTPQLVELGSINGVARPLVTASVPQGRYSSAELTYAPSTFVVIDHSGGQGSDDVGNYNANTPDGGNATVEITLSSPLVVSGSAMGVLLNLNIPASTTYVPYFDGSSSNFAPNGGQTTFSPVVTVSKVTLAEQPSTLLDGKVEDVHGQVTGSSGGALMMTSDSGAALSFNISGATVFAGATGTAAPAVGSFVDVDAALQSDGSMLATQVQNEGATQYNLVGQVVQYTELMYVQNDGREQQGPDLPNGTGFYVDNVELNTAPQFEIRWPGGSEPDGLPFTPRLGPASIVPGLNLATPVASQQYVNGIIPPTGTVTLEPQTIDATVASISTANGQTSYTVTLFNDDLISLFGSTATVVVYETAGTHTITSAGLNSGSVGRFRGLLFDDGGTLRMVATEIEDGVPEP